MLFGEGVSLVPVPAQLALAKEKAECLVSLGGVGSGWLGGTALNVSPQDGVYPMCSGLLLKGLYI